MVLVGKPADLHKIKTEVNMSKWLAWSEEEEEILRKMNKAKRFWRTKQEALTCFAKVLTGRSVSGIGVKVNAMGLEIRLAKQQIDQNELDAFFELAEEA